MMMRFELFENDYTIQKKKAEELPKYLNKFECKINLQGLKEKYSKNSLPSYNQEIFKFDRYKGSVDCVNGSLNELFVPTTQRYDNISTFSKNLEQNKFNYHKQNISKHKRTHTFTAREPFQQPTKEDQFSQLLKSRYIERCSNLLNNTSLTSEYKIHKIKSNYSLLLENIQQNPKYSLQLQDISKLNENSYNNLISQNLYLDDFIDTRNDKKDDESFLEYQKFLQQKDPNFKRQEQQISQMSTDLVIQDEALLKEQRRQAKNLRKSQQIEQDFNRLPLDFRQLLETENLFQFDINPEKYKNAESEEQQKEKIVNLLQGWIKTNDQVIKEGEKKIQDYHKYQKYSQPQQNIEESERDSEC